MTHELSLYYWFAIVNILTWAHAYYDGQRFGKLTKKHKAKRVIIRLAFLCTSFAFLPWQLALGVVVVTHLYCWNIFDPLVAMFAGKQPDYIGQTSTFDLIGRKISAKKYMAIKFILMVLAAAFMPNIVDYFS